MPGLTGLDVVKRLAGLPRRPQVVFVTAYEEYAVAAFEQCALDYLLKPATAARIGQAVDKLKAALARDTDGLPLARLEQLLARLQPAPAAAPAGYLQWIRAAQSGETRLVDIAEVLYFQSNDKYTSVVTREGESLIRTPLAELRDQLDPAQFWQIHRGTVVAVRAIAGTRHDLRGRLVVRLKERPEQLVVSRNFAAQFKQM
jgi:DNA-binding LytR/AlgR family response regulator